MRLVTCSVRGHEKLLRQSKSYWEGVGQGTVRATLVDGRRPQAETL